MVVLRYTERVLSIFNNAEMEAYQTTGVVSPIHLLLGFLKEKSVPCMELTVTYPKLKDVLYERTNEIHTSNGEIGIRST